MKKISKTTTFLIMMVLAMLTWGGSWTSGKMVAGSTAPEVIIFWRFFITFISFIPVVAIFKTPLKLGKRQLVCVLLGAVFLVAYNKLFFQGLRTGMAGGGGVLVTSLNPVFTFLFTVLIFKQKLGRKEIMGLILGFAGGMILLEIWSIDMGKLLASGNLLFLIAAMVWALLTITSHKSNTVSPLVFSFYVYGLSALLDLFLALPLGVTSVFNAGYGLWLNIIYLSVVVTTFGTTAYFFASQKLGASKASSFIFLVPASAVFFSWTLLGEQPKVPTIIGGIMAIGAVYIINSKSPVKAEVDEAPSAGEPVDVQLPANS